MIQIGKAAESNRNMETQKSKKAKVCILAAGIGSRMSDYSLKLNKGLLPVDDVAIISRIIDVFGEEYEFVIACGHLSEQVKNYIKIAHPKLLVKFVDVQPYTGPGSGPGYSLKSCKQAIGDSPFFIVVNDGVFKSDIKNDINTNWVGVFNCAAQDAHNYSVVEHANDKVFNIINKQKQTKDKDAFTGVCFIRDFETFWNFYFQQESESGLEVHFLSALLALARNDKLNIRKIDWRDFGRKELYETYLKSVNTYDFSKQDECIYFYKDKVIKFFSDQEIVNKRVKKSSLKKQLFPKEILAEGQFYSYSKVLGHTLYLTEEKEIFRKFLHWCETDLWIKLDFDKVIVKKACEKFYQQKTYDRLNLFKNKYPDYFIRNVNGKEVFGIEKYLEKLDWEDILNGLPSYMHGDLQPDNIIVQSNSAGFKLIDWRHEFGGYVEWGDLYYDLSKLMGGLYLNYSSIKKNGVQYQEADDKSVKILYLADEWSTSRIKILEEFIISRGYSLKKVKTLMPLIFLNMAPLHKAPFDKYLMALSLKLFSELTD
jgi:NDP-sugar pyrophosphorylase family protein